MKSCWSSCFRSFPFALFVHIPFTVLQISFKGNQNVFWRTLHLWFLFWILPLSFWSVTVLLPRDLGWTFESLNFSVHLNISSGLGYFVKINKLKWFIQHQNKLDWNAYLLDIKTACLINILAIFFLLDLRRDLVLCKPLFILWVQNVYNTKFLLVFNHQWLFFAFSSINLLNPDCFLQELTNFFILRAEFQIELVITPTS